jgi:hypothetical protein
MPRIIATSRTPCGARDAATNPFVVPGGGERALTIMVFAVVFGLSMDYEVFLVSRMHEEWVETRDDRYAVRHGLAITSRVVEVGEDQSFIDLTIGARHRLRRCDRTRRGRMSHPPVCPGDRPTC